MSLTLPESVVRKWWRPYFVETGFHEGDAVTMALRLGVEKIFSIECDKAKCDAGWKKFLPERRIGRVELIHGTSVDMLPYALNRTSKPALFWLDAHVDGGTVQSSIYRELELILENSISSNVILVDDLRVFGEPLSWGSGLSVEEMCNRILDLDPTVQFFREDSKVAKDDILVVVSG